MPNITLPLGGNGALWRRAGHQHLAEDLHQLAQLIAQAPSTPPRVTTWQHMVAVIRDMFRMGIGRFRFEIGMLVGILLGLMMAYRMLPQKTKKFVREAGTARPTAFPDLTGS